VDVQNGGEGESEGVRGRIGIGPKNQRKLKKLSHESAKEN